MNVTAQRIRSCLQGPAFTDLALHSAQLLDLNKDESESLHAFQAAWEQRLLRLCALFEMDISEREISEQQCRKQLALEGIELSAHWMQLNDEINYKTVFNLGEDQLSIAKAYLCSKIIELIQPILHQEYVAEQTDSIKRHLATKDH